MKFISANLLVASVLCGVVSPSCVYRSNPVPDMPYRPRRHTPPAQAPIPDPVVKPVQAAAAPAAPAMLPAPAAPATTDAWMTSRTAPLPAPKPPVAQTPKPAPALAPVPAPASKATPPATSGTHITQAPLPPPATAPAPKPVAAAVQAPAAPAAQPAPAAAPVSAAAPAAADPKLISNNGAIPVATRVPGDPLRVYNPLDPSKKIKVIDKSGNPQPSGKKLKVPGTNFFFYVP